MVPPPTPIEHEVVVQAPIEVVWRTLTDADQIVKWFADRADLEVRAGGHGRFVFSSGDDHTTHIVPIVVEVVEPPHRFAFRWCHPENEQAGVGNSLLVEFNLVALSAARTRLRVAEHGLESLRWSKADKDRYREEHRRGWEDFLGRLARVAGSAHGPSAPVGDR